MIFSAIMVLSESHFLSDAHAGSADGSAIDRTVLPMPLSPFTGKIGKTYKDSKAAWPLIPSAPEGAPNIVVIMLDDVGYGQTGTFGGPVPTPKLDELAKEGLRFTRFHTTAICGPSRAALITGRNHHMVATGSVAQGATGFPGYNTMIRRNTATMGSIFKYNGYSTAWFGKNHNTPVWESSVSGPFDRWPSSMGFDYFYGFISGETDQYYPVLFENTIAVEPDKSPEEGYHFMTDMTDRAIDWMRYSKSISPQKPLLLYFAPGAAHAPHQPPEEWRKKFKGTFRDGWDVMREKTYKRQLELGVIPEGTRLTDRPDWARNWDTLSDEQRTVYSALMDNYAAFLAFTDHETGRLLDAIRKLPDAENTIIVYIVGDNGASSEGGINGTINEIRNLNGLQGDLKNIARHIDNIGAPGTEPHYPLEWAWAGNTPFQWVKQVASHLGGVRNPMIISWPARIKKTGTIRTQFTHLIDVLPTLLEAAGLPAPKLVDGFRQKDIEGSSFLSVFDEGTAPEIRTRQYFSIFTNRSVYDRGWKANARHTLPWRMDLASGDWSKDRWELYNLNEDYSEANDLAATMPEKLEEMKRLYLHEAGKYGIFPFDDRVTQRFALPKPAPYPRSRKQFVFYPGAIRLPESTTPDVKNKSHTIRANLTIPKAGANGVIVAQGGNSAGFSLFMRDSRLVYHYNWFDTDRFEVVSDKALQPGDARVRMDFTYDGTAGEKGKGGTATLFINDKKAGSIKISRTVPARFYIDTFGVGMDTGSPVVNTYKPPHPFTGKINKVEIDLK